MSVCRVRDLRQAHCYHFAWNKEIQGKVRLKKKLAFDSLYLYKEFSTLYYNERLIIMTQCTIIDLA